MGRFSLVLCGILTLIVFLFTLVKTYGAEGLPATPTPIPQSYVVDADYSAEGMPGEEKLVPYMGLADGIKTANTGIYWPSDPTAPICPEDSGLDEDFECFPVYNDDNEFLFSYVQNKLHVTGKESRGSADLEFRELVPNIGLDALFRPSGGCTLEHLDFDGIKHFLRCNLRPEGEEYTLRTPENPDGEIDTSLILKLIEDFKCPADIGARTLAPGTEVEGLCKYGPQAVLKSINIQGSVPGASGCDRIGDSSDPEDQSTSTAKTFFPDTGEKWWAHKQVVKAVAKTFMNNGYPDIRWVIAGEIDGVEQWNQNGKYENIDDYCNRFPGDIPSPVSAGLMRTWTQYYLVTAQAIREAAEELGLPEPEIGGPYTALLLGPIVETDEDGQPILDEDGNQKVIRASAWFVKLVNECAIRDPLPWYCGGVRPDSWRDYVNFISSEHYYWNRWDELQNPPQYDFEEFDTKLQVDILLADFEAEGVEGLTSADIRLDPIGGNFTRFGTEFGEQASSGAALFVNQLIQLARMVDEGEELKGAAFYSAFALTDYIPPDENGPFDDGFWSPAFAGDSNWWTEPYYEDKYMTPSGTAFHLVNQFVADDVEVLPIPSGSRAFQLMLGRDMPGESILLLAANYDNAPASVDLNVQNLPLGQWVLDEAYQVDETARPLAELPNFRDLPADPPRIENGTVHFRIPPFGVRYLRFRRTNYITDPIEE